MELLKKGGFQILRDLDRSGRTVVVMLSEAHLGYDVITISRVFYYVHMVALRFRPETRTRGVVHILYSVGYRNIRYSRAEKMAKMFGLLPIKTVAVHYCYDSPQLFDTFAKCLKAEMDSFYLCRFRSHVGSHSDVAKELAGFGILSTQVTWPIKINFQKEMTKTWKRCLNNSPTTELPDNGTTDQWVDLQWQSLWIHNTRIQEEEDEDATVVLSGQNQMIVEYGNNNDLATDNSSVQFPVVPLSDEAMPSKSASLDQHQMHNTQLYNNDEFGGNIEDGDQLSKPIHPSSPGMPPGTDESNKINTVDEMIDPFPIVQQQAEVSVLTSTPTTKTTPGCSSSSAAAIRNPGPMDIIVRRGRHSKTSQGYQYFRTVLESYRASYDASVYGEKGILVDRILMELTTKEDDRGPRCRFLKRHCNNDGQETEEWYVVCTDEEIREKIAHTFRGMREIEGRKKRRKES